MPFKQFKYDVFLSYRQSEPDCNWVRCILEPKLKLGGLATCIDIRDFQLGETLLLEMERAVEQSRYTLAVLSPAYLESNFTELENLLAGHLGLEESRNRLIVVQRAPCHPPLRMRANLWLDMQDDSQFKTNVNKLISQLKLPSGD